MRKCSLAIWTALTIWIASLLCYFAFAFPHAISILSVGDIIPTGNIVLWAILEALFIFPVEPLILFGIAGKICEQKREEEEEY